MGCLPKDTVYKTNDKEIIIKNDEWLFQMVHVSRL